MAFSTNRRELSDSVIRYFRLSSGVLCMEASCMLRFRFRFIIHSSRSGISSK